MTPSVGRVVHYVARGSLDGLYPPACRAATITEGPYDEDQTVGLAVFNPTGLFFHPRHPDGCEYHAGSPAEVPTAALCGGNSYRGGSWHWPART
jgi:hypothetical protein